MAVTGLMKTEIAIPKDITVKYEGETLVVKGKSGEISRKLRLGRIQLSIDGKVQLQLELPKKRELAEFNAVASEVRSAIEGAEKGVEYRLKIVYAHFPIKVQVKGSEVLIENFLGERFPRRARVMGKAKVSVSGDQITVTSANIEEAGQTAANIERATRIKNYDRRVFQDGIYIVQKAGKVLV